MSNLKKDIIFVDYDCIRNIPYLILKYLRDDKFIQSVLGDYIDFEKIIPLTDDQIYYITLKRRHRNIFKCIPMKNSSVDFDSTLEGFYNNQLDFLIKDYDERTYNSIMYAIRALMQMEFTDTIYIWTKNVNPNILEDILIMFDQSSKLKYVTGEFKDVIQDLPEISLYILDDADHVNTLNELNKLHMKELMVSNFYFNIKNKDEYIMRVEVPEDCKSALYSPVNANINKVNKIEE